MLNKIHFYSCATYRSGRKRRCPNFTPPHFFFPKRRVIFNRDDFGKFLRHIVDGRIAWVLQAQNFNEQIAGFRQVNIDVVDNPLPYYTRQATLAEGKLVTVTYMQAVRGFVLTISWNIPCTHLSRWRASGWSWLHCSSPCSNSSSVRSVIENGMCLQARTIRWMMVFTSARRDSSEQGCVLECAMMRTGWSRPVSNLYTLSTCLSTALLFIRAPK